MTVRKEEQMVFFSPFFMICFCLERERAEPTVLEQYHYFRLFQTIMQCTISSTCVSLGLQGI